MSRFDTCGCIGKSLIITCNFLWYVVPTIAHASLILIFQSEAVVFWVLIGSTIWITPLWGKVGMHIGREIIKDKMAWRDVWNFVPWEPRYFWCLTHLLSSLPVWEFTNLLTSLIWSGVEPGWLVTCVWLLPVISFFIGGGIGAVIISSYREPNPGKPNDTTPLLV